jgi:hypothetical protein
MEVIPPQQAGWTNLLRGSLLQELPDKLVGIEVAVAGEAIQAVQCQVFLEARKTHKSF